MSQDQGKYVNVSLTLQIKRGREEIEFAQKECERLFKLIEGGTVGSDSVQWAIKRIERIQEMILMPSDDQFRREVQAKINKELAAGSSDVI